MAEKEDEKYDVLEKIGKPFSFVLHFFRHAFYWRAPVRSFMCGSDATYERY